MPLIVVALGGNALLRGDAPPTADAQRRAAGAAAAALAPVLADHDVVITHGNGPQIGLLALQGEAYEDVPPAPLDVLGAQTQGLIGYLLEQALADEVPQRRFATVLTRVRVDADDPAFDDPTKPIGATYDEQAARALAEERGWAVARHDAGWRRVVPSPEPRAVIPLPAIRLLLQEGVVPICAGGGGIPVVGGADGGTAGVEAVIDKDLSSALLAIDLRADGLLLLTDVEGVQEAHGTADARVLERVTPAALRQLDLPAGSMGPKAEAAARVVEATGGWAAIGRLEAAGDIIAGAAGTRVEGP